MSAVIPSNLIPHRTFRTRSYVTTSLARTLKVALHLLLTAGILKFLLQSRSLGVHQFLCVLSSRWKPPLLNSRTRTVGDLQKIIRARKRDFVLFMRILRPSCQTTTTCVNRLEAKFQLRMFREQSNLLAQNKWEGILYHWTSIGRIYLILLI